LARLSEVYQNAVRDAMMHIIRELFYPGKELQHLHGEIINVLSGIRRGGYTGEEAG
jgi:hypothetical protein